MCVPRCDLQRQQLFVLQTHVLWNSAIHCSMFPTDCQGFAVVSAFGCSSSWIQFLLVLIWKFKSSILLFYHTINERPYSVWIRISCSGSSQVVENSVSGQILETQILTPIFGLLVSTPVGCFPFLDQLERNMCCWVSVEGWNTRPAVGIQWV